MSPPTPFNPDRYDSMIYRRCRRSGLRLPAIRFGLWQGAGSHVCEAASRDIVHTAIERALASA